MKPPVTIDQVGLGLFSSEGARSTQDPPLPDKRYESGGNVRVPSAPHACIANHCLASERRNAMSSKAALACFQSESVMSSREEIAAIQARIAKAESERDSWRGSGRQEKYLEAYSMVEALELQLDQLRKAPQSVTKSNEAVPERERLMAEFFIAFNGRYYLYGPYRDDHLSDAVNYARLQRANVGAGEIGATPAPEQVDAPSESQRQLMNTLDITFAGGVYRLGACRYDRLADAVAYARLSRRP